MEDLPENAPLINGSMLKRDEIQTIRDHYSLPNVRQDRREVWPIPVNLVGNSAVP